MMTMNTKVVTMHRTVPPVSSKDNFTHNGPKKKMPKFVCWSNKMDRKSGILLRGNSRVDLGNNVGNGGIII